jgi:Ca2+/Na+ antiporter
MEALVNLFPSTLLIAGSCIIIWRSSDGFELASDFLGRKLPPGIKGATLNAIASSMPEFLTTLFFLFYLRDADGFSGGLGVTSGSALFNLLIIPALAVAVVVSARNGKRIILDKKVLLREGLVLLLSQVLFLRFLFDNELKAIHGFWLVLFYAGYLLLLFLISRRQGKADPGFEIPGADRQVPWRRRIVTLDITRLVLNGRKMNPARAWIMLLVSTAVMTLGTWMLVLGTDRFGEEAGIPLIFVAVVLSAAATSVPDTIISIKDARKGNYDDAISNALGSNIFDIAFALGLPILLYDLFYRDSIRLPDELSDFTREVWVFLLLATVLALLVMLAGKYFSRLKAWILLGIYLIFLLFVGTQVNREIFGGISETIREFLTGLADWMGKWI